MTLLRSRKTGDEVHLNLVPFPFRNREWLQSSSRSLMFCFHATANVTFINITSNVLLHVRPPVPLSNVLVHLGTTRVNRQRCIVSFFHDIRGVVQVGLFWGTTKRPLKYIVPSSATWKIEGFPLAR